MNFNLARRATGLLKQSTDKPLFPDILWSRPENKRHAGKLLIIGGHATSLSAPAKAFAAAEKAGVGAARVVLPDATQKVLGKTFVEAEFVASNPSGSFGQAALGQILDASQWADGILLAGDFGKNSETIILLEKFILKYSGLLVIAGDAIDPLLQNSSNIFTRPQTLLVIEFSKLQKMAKHNFPQPPLLNSADITQTIEILNSWSHKSSAGLLTQKNGHVIVVFGGQASATSVAGAEEFPPELSAYAAVWWLQQPKKPFEAITTGVYASLSY